MEEQLMNSQIQSTEPPILPAVVCSRCGAVNPPHAKSCWLCVPKGSVDPKLLVQNPYAQQPLEFRQSPEALKAESRRQGICLALLGICIILTVMIGIGLAVEEPGTLVLLAIAVGPAYLATGVKAITRYSSNAKPKPSELLVTFMYSGMITAGAIGLLIMVSFICFLVWCFTYASPLGH